jgi:hypothetical protein
MSLRTPTGYKYVTKINNYEIFERKQCNNSKENKKVTCRADLFPPYLKYSFGQRKYFEAQSVSDEPTELSSALSNMILDANGDLKEEFKSRENRGASYGGNKRKTRRHRHRHRQRRLTKRKSGKSRRHH